MNTGSNILLLVSELENNKDFNFLWNYQFNHTGIFRYNQRGSLANCYYSPHDFIAYFCKAMPYFPASVVSDARIPTPAEVHSCAMYIITTLFIAACMDTAVNRFITTGTAIEGYEFGDTGENVFTTNYVRLHIVDRSKGIGAYAHIALPSFTNTAFESFGSIPTIKNSCRVTLTVGKVMQLTDIHLNIGLGNLLDNFKTNLTEQIAEFKNKNSL